MSQEVRGQVKDRVSDQGIAAGVVTLVGVADGRLIGHVAVGPQGQYAFRVPGAGRYLLQFIGPGYGPSTTGEFTLAAGETRIVALPATPLPAVALDTVVVEGLRVPARLQGFYQRRAAGLGEFVTRDEINALNALKTTDILYGTEGVSVVRFGAGVRVASRQDPTACARTDGPSGPLVFLDGFFLGTGMQLDLDALLGVHTIDAVEIYSGAAEVPPEFGRSGAECGVVGLWTRAAVPEPVVASTPFEAGGQIGTWVSSQGLQETRFGVRVVIGLRTKLEMSVVINQLVVGLETGTAGTDRSGTQIVLALRGQPLGQRLPLYLGGGLTFLSLHRSQTAVDDEQHFLGLGGLILRSGRLRPFVEIHALDPLGDAQINVYTGATIRLY